MKRLLIALMALSLVLVAVSFASAQINLENLESILYVEAVENVLAPFQASIPGVQVSLEPYQALSEPQTYNNGEHRRGERERHEGERHGRFERERHEGERHGRFERERHEGERHGRFERERHERERHHGRCERERHESRPYETGQYAYLGRR
jgi:hypothetical protein